jgi:hypothetical protein
VDCDSFRARLGIPNAAAELRKPRSAAPQWLTRGVDKYRACKRWPRHSVHSGTFCDDAGMRRSRHKWQSPAELQQQVSASQPNRTQHGTSILPRRAAGPEPTRVECAQCVAGAFAMTHAPELARALTGLAELQQQVSASQPNCTQPGTSNIPRRASRPELIRVECATRSQVRRMVGSCRVSLSAVVSWLVFASYRLTCGGGEYYGGGGAALCPHHFIHDSARRWEARCPRPPVVSIIYNIYKKKKKNLL